MFLEKMIMNNIIKILKINEIFYFIIDLISIELYLNSFIWYY